MSIYNSPELKNSQEKSFLAELAWKKGDRNLALKLFEEAAESEERAALTVSGQKKLKSILSVSAISLWIKSQRYDKAESLAYECLALKSEYSEEGISEIKSYLEQIWRDKDFVNLLQSGFFPIEVKLEGGRIKKGLAPASIVRERQDCVVSLLSRINEYQLQIPFRQNRKSKEQSEISPEIYEGPAVAASYGIRLFVSSKQNLQNAGKKNTERLVAKFLEITNLVHQCPQDLSKLVNDTFYRQSILEDFKNISPEGEKVERVQISCPHWLFQGQDYIFETDNRERITAAYRGEMQQTSGEITISGILRLANYKKRGNFAVIEIETDEQFRSDFPVYLKVKVSKDLHDLGTYLNRRVLLKALMPASSREFVELAEIKLF
jgi:hypothetical protein